MIQESGRSMVEMLGVLAIMGVITVGAVGMISVATNSQKRNTVNDDVMQIVSGVRQLLGQYDDYSHINNATIFGAMGLSNTNPYGGTYSLATDPSNAHQFIVTIDGLSKTDCEYLVTRAWTDSVGYRVSDHKQGGATGNCNAANGRNSVQITYGD